MVALVIFIGDYVRPSTATYHLASTDAVQLALISEDIRGVMTREYLGVSLDKSEQISAWNRRPLRPNQIKYATADASVLVDIYLCYKKAKST